jgi:hypothetical protein
VLARVARISDLRERPVTPRIGAPCRVRRRRVATLRTAAVVEIARPTSPLHRRTSFCPLHVVLSASAFKQR